VWLKALPPPDFRCGFPMRRRRWPIKGGNVFSTRTEGSLQIRIWADGQLDLMRDTDKTVLFRLGAFPRWHAA
jgi:hypothetical protein